jgi:hypothetical protein
MEHIVKITYCNDGTCAYLNVAHAAQVCITRLLYEATRMDQETADRWVHWLNKPEPIHYVVEAVPLNKGIE